MSRVARSRPAPKPYVLRALSAMLPPLSKGERDVIVAAYGGGIEPELVGELLRAARKVGIHMPRARPELLELLKAKAGAKAPASTRRGARRANTTPPSGDAE